VDEAGHRQALIAVLQLAYSGERAAGYAYRGHWRACSDPEERAHIHRIEDEEWHHRELVGGLLADLGGRPRPAREWRAVVIGRSLQFLSYLSPWWFPMYGAGKLESGNVREYETAAAHAHGCGRADLIDCLLTMAEVEWDHELYFRRKVEGHWLTRLVGLWPVPPPRDSIRAARPSAPPAGARRAPC
jgi:rubrerythrin